MNVNAFIDKSFDKQNARQHAHAFRATNAYSMCVPNFVDVETTPACHLKIFES